MKHFGLDTLRDLPDLEALEDAGLLNGNSGAATTMPIGAMAEDDFGNHDDEGVTS
ncbi:MULTISPECIES: hypothetical protein [unclassified Mesorhizobium]|uniref:hypothetical protein n=1 Tax=unclassified Mesorhizobium TaxID=325217 RepID=UPI001FDFFBED|nr:MULTISPECIES: hypothetical protein [unclassified Mesorhizobium]